MTKMKSEGVKAIAITTPPGALGSTAVQNVNQGLNVPIIGTSVAFAPTLLTDPAVEAALKNYYMISSAVTIGSDKPAAKDLLAKYKEKTTDQPSIGVIHGYVWGKTWEEILKAACDAGDMTRDGILAARKKITSVDTGDLFGPLDLSNVGGPTSRQAYILTPDKNAEGGLTVKAELFESEEAKTYKATYEK